MAAAIEQDELLPAEAGKPAEPGPAGEIWLTRPGIYDIPEKRYHQDPVPGGSLSCSVAKKLIKDCPAIARYELDHPQGPKKVFDLGTAFHQLVLGRGAELVVVERADGKPEWNTNEVKAEVEAVRAAGKTPLKRAELAAAKRMAAAVFDHPIAGPLFRSKHGVAEQTIVSTHERTGIPLRSMLDWIDFTPGMPPLIGDLKSASDVSPRGIWSAVKDFYYFMQDPFYRNQVASLGHDPAEIGFVFVFVRSSPPHLVTVGKLTDQYLAKGWERNEEAINLWVQCTESGIWPGYSSTTKGEEIEDIEMPGWMA